MTQLNSLDFDPNKLTLTWADGSSSQFHAVWLRDNVLEEDARHKNGQRLFDWSELPRDFSMKSAEVDGDTIKINFNAGDRQSSYPIEWLKTYAYDNQAPEKSYEIWGKDLDLSVIYHDYTEVQKGGQAMCDWLKSVRKYGFGIIQNVPQEEGMVLNILNSFGFVRETNYGKLFEVRTEENPNNLAFTPLGLNVHTDNPYRDPVPGLQALHCLESNNDGGESVFVDGYKVAELLRQEEPIYFDLLSSYHANFRFCDGKADLKNRATVIGVDNFGHFTHIRYNNRSAAPLNLPANVMEDYYTALLAYADMLHREEVEVLFKLKQGELVLFDNERVLHGRKGFAGGKRHLQGSYADKDSLNSWINIWEAKQ
ncbi:2-trimethylaminoethylphosphonate dioxygenase [Curvivirga sp.]|uniref:2-trimethylaminoethylphosphonate dioxygenase n=1 Tax=Curvivirga sp. TaxID=2856848 RepID=UPI003B5C02BA